VGIRVTEVECRDMRGTVGAGHLDGLLALIKKGPRNAGTCSCLAGPMHGACVAVQAPCLDRAKNVSGHVLNERLWTSIALSKRFNLHCFQ
jgi:hypothetical protein